MAGSSRKVRRAPVSQFKLLLAPARVFWSAPRDDRRCQASLGSSKGALARVAFWALPFDVQMFNCFLEEEISLTPTQPRSGAAFRGPLHGERAARALGQGGESLDAALTFAAPLERLHAAPSRRSALSTASQNDNDRATAATLPRFELGRGSPASAMPAPVGRVAPSSLRTSCTRREASWSPSTTSSSSPSPSHHALRSLCANKAGLGRYNGCAVLPRHHLGFPWATALRDISFQRFSAFTSGRLCIRTAASFRSSIELHPIRDRSAPLLPIPTLALPFRSSSSGGAGSVAILVVK
ncbi:uncharacterized protein PAN0_003c1852 [Moesziomyces antarcticus]|uniref:uncharacterized protein n=1 Tax=Pseudozyma antarctica TaxID=84753 RepID=UPI0007196943|nr:uncharacterized protein PAN0_003c1852 [Moesziomyces antarcticus]GAK63646.1 hypothetical protein PAN0_003c1852 [Moesziomyces antarcticus]